MRFLAALVVAAVTGCSSGSGAPSVSAGASAPSHGFTRAQSWMGSQAVCSANPGGTGILADGDWALTTWQFQAHHSSARLEFISDDEPGASCGPAVAAISVSQS
jgi:hypothetical protein